MTCLTFFGLRKKEEVGIGLNALSQAKPKSDVADMEAAKSLEIRVLPPASCCRRNCCKIFGFFCLILTVFLMFTALALLLWANLNPNPKRTVRIVKNGGDCGFVYTGSGYNRRLSVTLGGPASRAGLTSTDEIFSINGFNLSDLNPRSESVEPIYSLLNTRADEAILTVRSQAFERKLPPLNDCLPSSIIFGLFMTFALFTCVCCCVAIAEGENLNNIRWEHRVSLRRSSGEYGLVVEGNIITEVDYRGSQSAQLKKGDQIVSVNNTQLVNRSTDEIEDLFDDEALELIVLR